MSNTAQAATTINAPAAAVWDALINPNLIKQYMFGTIAASDWKMGSTVTYRGEWEGKPYEDRGVILEMEPEKRIVMDYSSSFSGGTEDPKSHRIITYTLESTGDQTVLTVVQDNNPDAAATEESTRNWQYILGGLKKLLEK